MGHYFTAEPESKSARRLLSVNFANKNWQIETDNEVFAKKGLDRGTAVLVQALLDDLVAHPFSKNTIQASKESTNDISFYDLACGWGAVALLVSGFYPAWTYYLSDINSRACDLANANLKRANVANYQIQQASDLTAWPNSKFDIIALNPPIRTGKNHVKELLARVPQYLQEAGRFYCVIGKKQGAASYANYLCELAPEVGCFYELLSKQDGFYLFKLEKIAINLQQKENN